MSAPKQLPSLMLLLALLGLSSSATFAATQATYYVSPTGNDANPGTLASPFQTLAKAQAVVRTVNSSMTGDILVTLRGGTYPLSSTLSFGVTDGGTNGFYVRYVNYTGETPLLTGGQPIGGWTVYDQAKNIWKATGVTSSFRQLYVNGTKAIRARSPNLGTGGALNFDRFINVDKTAHDVQVASSYVSNWNNFTKVEMHLMASWSDQTMRLASYTVSGTTAYVKFQKPEDNILFVRSFPMFAITAAGKGQCLYFENALEFLDSPGEWYLNDSTHTLYYMPRTGENMASATVVAPILQTVLSVGGSSTTLQAGYLWFQGLAFAHSTYMRPSSAGLLDNQAGIFNVAPTQGNTLYFGRPAAGVVVTNANHIHFEGDIFAQMAATGLDFISGTHDDKIIGNVFTDIGGSGISLGKFSADTATEGHIAYNPTDKNEICTNDTIMDNYITNVTTEIQGTCGIVAGYPRFIDIEHNEVSNTNYTGISVGFGWTSTPNAMTNNKINYNDVHNVCNFLADGGGIYTLSNQGTGSEEEYNYIHDYATKPTWADYDDHGIYMDQETSGYTVSNNVLFNCPGIFKNSIGTPNTIANNAGTTPPTGVGIEAAYAAIKNNLAIPLPKFSGTTGIMSGAGSAGTLARTSMGMTGSVLHLDLTGWTRANLEVFDLTGRKIAASQLSVMDGHSSLDLRTLAGSGVRELRVTGDGGRLTQQVVLP
jgi:hypothetical protein